MERIDIMITNCFYFYSIYLQVTRNQLFIFFSYTLLNQFQNQMLQQTLFCYTERLFLYTDNLHL